MTITIQVIGHILKKIRTPPEIVFLARHHLFLSGVSFLIGFL
jgi:hypothetical protein